MLSSRDDVHNVQQSLVDLAVRYNDLSPMTQSPDLPNILPAQRKAIIAQHNKAKQHKSSHDDNDIQINNQLHHHNQQYNPQTDTQTIRTLSPVNLQSESSGGWNGVRIAHITSKTNNHQPQHQSDYSRHDTKYNSLQQYAHDQCNGNQYINNNNNLSTLDTVIDPSTNSNYVDTPAIPFDSASYNSGGSSISITEPNTLHRIISEYKSQNSSLNHTPMAPHTDTQSSHPIKPTNSSSSNSLGDRILSTYEIVCICLPAAAVQIGWCIGEALLIPYLLSLGISATIANLIFLINPVFNVVVHPLIGKWSDNSEFRYGKRTPFLFCLHTLAALGMLGVMCSEQITRIFGQQPFDSSGNANVFMLLTLFISFGIMDFAHDLLLLPARALLNDVLPSEQTDYGNSCFSLMTSAGACIGLLFILIPLETLYPLRLLFTQPITATFALSFILLNISNGVSTFMAYKLNNDKQLHEPHPSSVYSTGLNGEMHGEIAAASTELVLTDIQHTHDAIQRKHPHTVLHINTDMSEQPNKSTENDESDTGEGLFFLFQVLRTQPWQLTMVWCTQLSWWYACLHITLWWTSYVTKEVLYSSSGYCVRLATAGLLINAITALCTSIALSKINRSFGPVLVYYTGCIIFGCTCISIYFIPHTYIYTLGIMFILGLCMPAFLSNPSVLIYSIMGVIQ